ncbi:MULTISPECIES: CdaR family transcriptional regulator [unclassified Streptomyces]|uniref:PucR family transcriptional regulator n=1 Tax=unclassified Streptomyces TaxID=2593676 RepID=UPI000A577119|nr:helix-turn-helix domain-containing protein [Streptomyces sp. TSRI0281]
MEPTTLSPRTDGAPPVSVPLLIGEVRDELRSRFAPAADRMAAQILVEDPAYARLIGRKELGDRIHRNLCQALTGVAQAAQNLPVDLQDAMSTGSRRVEQGLPLASLLHSYRRGGRLLWEMMYEVIAERHPTALPVLLPAAAVVWDVLEQITDAVAESYRQAEAARAARDQERRHSLLDALLDGSGVAAGLASEAAARLGLPERGRYAVIVLRPVPGALPPSSDPGAELFSGLRILWRIRADGETGLVPLGSGSPEDLRKHLAGYDVRAGVSPVVGSLADLGRARWLAELALRTWRPGGAPTVLLDERLPDALVAAQSDLARRLRTVVLGRVLALPAEECGTLLTTLGVWLRAGGSSVVAAERLYCHRNTVSNRLRRLEQLTGRTLTDPAGAVELSLALAAVEQLGAQ